VMAFLTSGQHCTNVEPALRARGPSVADGILARDSRKLKRANMAGTTGTGWQSKASTALPRRLFGLPPWPPEGH
jgi:hypothetical protein